MLSDGSNAFSWNARNQVATLNSVSLQYDGFGRRAKNLQNTSFLFDGANAVQELSGSTPTANLISGGIDEIFARADASGAYTPLTDALGSKELLGRLELTMQFRAISFAKLMTFVPFLRRSRIPLLRWQEDILGNAGNGMMMIVK